MEEDSGYPTIKLQYQEILSKSTGRVVARVWMKPIESILPEGVDRVDIIVQRRFKERRVSPYRLGPFTAEEERSIRTGYALGHQQVGPTTVTTKLEYTALTRDPGATIWIPPFGHTTPAREYPDRRTTSKARVAPTTVTVVGRLVMENEVFGLSVPEARKLDKGVEKKFNALMRGAAGPAAVGALGTFSLIVSFLAFRFLYFLLFT